MYQKGLVTCAFELAVLGLAEGEIGKRHFESIIDHLHATTDLAADFATLTSTSGPGCEFVDKASDIPFVS